MKPLPMRLVACLVCLVSLPVLSTAAVDRDRIEEADFTKTVTVAFDGTTATVTGASGAGVTVSQGTNTSAVTITSTANGVKYVLSGTSTNGYAQITSTHRCEVVLDDVSLSSSNGPALSIFSTERAFIVLPSGTSSALTDSASYSRTGKGTLHGSGPLIVSGNGHLALTSLGGHGLYTDKSLRIFGGAITVAAAAKDAIHPKTTFRLDGGSLTLAAASDGIDAASGIVIAGGRITYTSDVADVKGFNTDGNLEIYGGTASFTMSGDQSKAMSAGGDATIAGGAIFAALSGDVVLGTVTSDDGSTYVDPSYCTALKVDGNLTLGGGSLVVTHSGVAGKGISVDGNVTITYGTYDATLTGGSSASYVDADGVTDVASPDAIKADGSITIADGTFIIHTTGASADAISADETLTVNGGTFTIVASGNQSKGLKSKGAMYLAGGTFNFAMSGSVVLEAVATSRYDPSYCTAIKCNTDLTLSGGTFTITHSGTAGKGVSVDGNIVMTGGTFNITDSGGTSSSFTNASGTLDMASADCFKADGNLTITGGTLNATATGTGGDAVSCDGVAIIGTLGVDDTPVLSVHTTGSQVLLSGSDYVNPKAFKAGGNLTVNGGSFTASTIANGGEGMESKANLVIAGGTIEINAYDDCINAATSITITGGKIYCYSSGNDGIDSNGTLKITGGTIVSSGTNAPEEGLDCDNNTFTITGGIIVGTGGSTSTPTSSTSTQRSVIYKGAGTVNVIVQVKSSSGDNLVYKLPRTYSGGGGPGGPGGGSSSTPMTMLFSNPSLASGTTYTILSGATISGGTEFHGLYTGATVTGGTTLKTFTPTSIVTTVQ